MNITSDKIEHLCYLLYQHVNMTCPFEVLIKPNTKVFAMCYSLELSAMDAVLSFSFFPFMTETNNITLAWIKVVHHPFGFPFLQCIKVNL